MNATAFILALIIALGYYFGKTRAAKKRQKKQKQLDNNENGFNN
ncbi:MAG: hypothetical protein WCV63_06045 [Negativicutes bacterium]|jgi:preprotein translocase subunit YajC